MIFPWLQGFKNASQSPVAWSLALINVFFFLLLFSSKAPLRLSDSDLAFTSRVDQAWQHQSVDLDSEVSAENGYQVLSRQSFWDLFEQGPVVGDPVQFFNWKMKMREFKSSLETRATYIFGVSEKNILSFAVITYQFVHAHLFHLLGNVLLLLILAVALENSFGSWPLLALYLGGGVAGAWAFVQLNPDQMTPVVGASASLSALLAFYAIAETKRRVRFFYVVGLGPGQFGEVYLPTILLLVFYFIEDLGAQLAHLSAGTTVIAHAAHIGGATYGLCLGLLVLAVRRARSKSPAVQTPGASYSP